MTKLSIVTINLNNAEGLLKTINSIISQSEKPFEYLIIDGGSTDNSIEVIRKYEKSLAYWISEKDKGVYEAMNKGTRAATGNYLLFLNSGDVLADERVLEKINLANLSSDIIYGDLLLGYDNGTKILKQYPDRLTFDYFFRHESLPHPATFIRRSLFSKVGFYNQQLNIVADWEFWLKAIFLYGASYKRIPIPVSIFELNGISSQKENAERIQSEKDIVYKTYFGGIISDYENYQILSTDKRVIILKQLEQYPLLSKIATAGLMFLSWLASKTVGRRSGKQQ